MFQSRAMTAQPLPAAALVTGASRGLGRGIAQALAARRPRPWPSTTAATGRRRRRRWPPAGSGATRAEQQFALVSGDIVDGRRSAPHRRGDAGRARAARRPGQQRGDRAPRPRRHPGGHGGELRRADRREPQGTVLPLPGRGPALAGAPRTVAAARRLQARVRLVGLGRTASVNRGDYCVSKAGLAMAAKLWATRLAADGRAGLRGAARDHGHRHDGGGEGEIRPADRGGPGAAGTMGHAGRRRPARCPRCSRGSLPFSTGDVLNVDGGLHLERL